MANPFYDPGERRAAKVQDLFGAIASRYDLLNDLQSFGLHRSWKGRLVRLARPQPGERALDLCCGTGDLALALAQHGVEVVGLDFSERMLTVAAAKATSQSRPTGPTPHAASPITPLASRSSTLRTSPHFVRGDALRVPFRDDSFDVVMVGYGLRNLASWEAGLREMQRVARPGGRLLVLDFGKPANALWRSLYFGYLRFCVPWLGRVFAGNAGAYAYILESLHHYPAQQGVAAEMGELGLVGLRTVQLLGGVMSINYAEKTR